MKVFLVLLAGGLLGVVAILPFMMDLLRHLPVDQAGLSLPVVVTLALVQNGLPAGGITEELLMRLFLLSFVAWLLGRWWRTTAGMPTPGAFWVAIVVVALLFGLGHLPATAAIVPLTPALVMRALVLNGVAGVAFGHLYWKHGLEAGWPDT